MIGFVRRVRELRLLECGILAALTIAIIGFISPQQLTVTVYKVSLVCLFALIGFRLDRLIFPYARPDQSVSEEDARWAGMRRALLISAVILGGTIGV